MTLVELDDVVDWLKKNLQDFIFESWNIPMDYSEEDELTNALRISLEGGEYAWSGYRVIKKEG